MTAVGDQGGAGGCAVGAPHHATSGRPRQFDEEEVLEELVALFWRQGFSQTSMTDLVAATGVHKPSLYRTFGSKEELFATVLRRYAEERRVVFEGFVAGARDGVDGIHDFLDRIETEVADGPGRNGCLLLVASSELGGSMPGWEGFAVEYHELFRQLVRGLVVTAGPAGLVDDVVLDQRAELIVMAVFGIQMMARAGADAASLHRSVGALRATAESWR